MNAIAGHDPRDPTSSRRPVVDYVPDEDCSIRGVRIGFPESFFFEHLDEDVESAVRGAIARAESLGAVVKPVRLPDMAALNAVARVVLLSEASAVAEPYPEDRSLYGADVRALLDQGRLVPATDYINAQRLRRKMRREFNQLWNEVDCLMTPATPNPGAARRRHHRPAGRPRGGCAAGIDAPGARRERARVSRRSPCRAA